MSSRIGACQEPKWRRSDSAGSVSVPPGEMLRVANQYTQSSGSGTIPKRAPRPQVSPASSERWPVEEVTPREAVYPA